MPATETSALIRVDEGMPELARFAGDEVGPGPALSSDDELEAFIRDTVATTYHPVGTCKMGPAVDAMAIGDAQLRVPDVDGLRVADASIMPNLVGGNTSAPSMMIGERGAGFVLRGADQSAEYSDSSCR